MLINKLYQRAFVHKEEQQAKSKKTQDDNNKNQTIHFISYVGTAITKGKTLVPVCSPKLSPVGRG